MGNTHDTEVARIEADYICTRWKTNADYRWGYTKERGPDTWWLFYPSASGGNQSPVDIITEEVRPEIDSTRPPLQISHNWSRTEVRKFSNTGTAARVNILNGASYITEGPCRNYTYVLEQIDLHWGENDASGSEHNVNSRQYSAELHLAHWNEDLYESYEEAMRRDDGVVMLAVFVKICDVSPSRFLQKLSEHIDDVIYRDQSVYIPACDLDLSTLLPDDVSKYWTYRGSFTVPPCYETVTWIVFQEPISITKQCLNKFRQLRTYCENEVRPADEHDGQMLKNTRPIQPRGTRKILSVDEELMSHDNFAISGYYNMQQDGNRHDICNNDLENSGEYQPSGGEALQRRQELYQWKH